jgi:transposase
MRGTSILRRRGGLLAEFGVVLPQKPAVLHQHLNDVLEDASNDIVGMARLVRQRAQEHWLELEAHIRWCDERIAAHQKEDEQVQRAAELKGVGIITASAIVATVGNLKQFKNCAQFGAWLGLAPNQNSSGGKGSMGSITKRGDHYLRNLSIQGAKALLFKGSNNLDPISQWV